MDFVNNESSIRERLTQVLSPILNGRNPEKNWHLVNDLGMDSLALLRLCLDLEDAFQLDIPDEMCQYLCTTEDLYNFLKTRILSAPTTEKGESDGQRS